MTNTWCVITGDIVDSRGLAAGELDRVMSALAECGETIHGWMTTENRPLERFQGDGWQFALAEPRWALRAALVLRAAIRASVEAADTRLAIGIGRGEVGEQLSRSQGEAFEHSGTLLKEIKGRRRWRINDGFPVAAANALAHGLVAVCDTVSQAWTARQAEAFALRAQPDAPTMAQIAETLGVTQQTIQAHLSNARADTLLEACGAFERGWDEQ